MRFRLMLAVGSGLFCALANAADWNAPPHFHPQGNPPSEHTVRAQQAQRRALPFADTLDLDEARRGFIAAPEYRQIMADAGHVAWDMAKYDFLLHEGEAYDSIHPSLQRQAVLNMAYGLYEVTPGIYQLRGFDVANLTLIAGDTGWIVLDTLLTRETARAALAFANQQLGHRPVVAVVYSHSHADHFGGVRGIVDEADVRSGAVDIIAPAGFMEHAVAENIHAGNAMNRRLFFQFGALLPASPYGHVDQALGKGLAAGDIGLIPPTRIIDQPIQEVIIDGVRIVFQSTPGTEAPAEMNAYFPDKKAFWAAENITATIHNIYTLRGALVRDALEWSNQINRALYLFGQQTQVMFASHSWPRWGNERVQQVMRDQRDAYAHLNNGVLHLANQGVTINQVHNEYLVPASLQQRWHTRSYHSDVRINARAVINRYLGFWDANPATLFPPSPEQSAPLYVEMMGGAEKILVKSENLIAQGHYLLAQELLNKLIHAEPDNSRARQLLADVFEQLGYQQESTSIRNTYLAAALELRSGRPRGMPPRLLGPDLVRGMSTKLWLEYLGIRLDSAQAEGKAFAFNLITPDTGEQFVVELNNATLTSIEGFQADDAALTITIDRVNLEPVMTGSRTLRQQIDAGLADVAGDIGLYAELMAMLVTFDLGFDLIPGTGALAGP